MTKPQSNSIPHITNRETQNEQKFDFIINSADNLELNLNKKESENLVNRLNKGSNEKSTNFAKESIDFYNEMKKREKLYKAVK